MLTDKQLECIELLALGSLTKSEIAKQVGVSDRVIYKWQNNDEFKANLHRRAEQHQTALAHEGKMRMTAKGQIAIDNILNLANSAGSEKVKLDANIFVYEAIYGKATTRIQDITEENKKEDDFNLDDLDNWNDVDNVIELDRKAK